jgi:hypothetical protein
MLKLNKEQRRLNNVVKVKEKKDILYCTPASYILPKPSPVNLSFKEIPHLVRQSSLLMTF